MHALLNIHKMNEHFSTKFVLHFYKSVNRRFWNFSDHLHSRLIKSLSFQFHHAHLRDTNSLQSTELCVFLLQIIVRLKKAKEKIFVFTLNFFKLHCLSEAQLNCKRCEKKRKLKTKARDV